MFRPLFVFLLLFTCAVSVPARQPEAEGGYKVEAIGEVKADAVPAAVRGVLENKGLRVTDGSGKTICEIWFRKDIATAKAEVEGANFAQLQDGSLMGVINFPAATSDYRGQGIKAGYYTLRYAIMPVNGSHMGVSPTRDFFVLSPAGADTDPNAQIKGDALVKLSSQAAGSAHVSPWSLVSVTSKDGLPKVVTTEESHVILEVALPTKSGSLPVGVTIIGRTEG
ncbi:MAG: hypothetical protein U0Z53_18945 [Blastocatellia bacterium]